MGVKVPNEWTLTDTGNKGLNENVQGKSLEMPCNKVCVARADKCLSGILQPQKIVEILPIKQLQLGKYFIVQCIRRNLGMLNASPHQKLTVFSLQHKSECQFDNF